jgi:hypothetical protein
VKGSEFLSANLVLESISGGSCVEVFLQSAVSTKPGVLQRADLALGVATFPFRSFLSILLSLPVAGETVCPSLA